MFGHCAGYGQNTFSYNYNSCFGAESGYYNASGDYNVLMGYRAGYGSSASDFNKNSFMGSYSGYSITTGSYNTFIGYGSGYKNLTGNYNVLIGYNAGYWETSSNKLYIENSLATSTSALIYGEFDNNLLALNANVGINTTNPGDKLEINGGGVFVNANSAGTHQTYSSLTITENDDPIITLEDDLNFVAYLAAEGTADNFILGSENNFLFKTGVDFATGPVSSGTIVMNIQQNGQILMPGVYDDVVGATNRDLYIDNTGKLGYLSSSEKYKKDIKDMENINWLYLLRPVNFIYKNDKSNTTQYGLIAEEVEKVNKLFVSYNDNGQVETVNYSQLITPMLKTILEQEKRITEIEKRNAILENNNVVLKNELDNMKAEIKALNYSIKTNAPQ
ncbi:MAG: tail fiber domain-containing protein [Bacteroidia bacterium]|nr:tail fiber domain-containing protein [Bacteroidia bacterium]